MKRIVLFFLLSLACTSLLSQTIENDTLKVYTLSISNYPFKVELIKKKNNQYLGNLVTKLKQGKSYHFRKFTGRLWARLWNIKTKEFVDRKPLDSILVKKLMTELYENNIELIKDCRKDEKCRDLLFLHAQYFSITIKTNEIDKNYEYEGIRPLNSETAKETIPIRKHAQVLLTVFLKYFDFDEEFKELYTRLPKNHYSYFEGYITTGFKTKGKK